jgi:hypothetical protein
LFSAQQAEFSRSALAPSRIGLIDVPENEVIAMAGLSSTLCLLVTFALVIVLRVAIPGSAIAAESNPAPADTIPAGTVITGANWQRYSRFMPAGMQAIFAGDHFWRMPPDVHIEIGPAIPIALPHKFLDDTASYAKQVKLTQAAEGGYIPVGYVAGIPFPQPDKDPVLAPYEIFYDAYYHYAITHRGSNGIFLASTSPIPTETSPSPRPPMRSIRSSCI